MMGPIRRRDDLKKEFSMNNNKVCSNNSEAIFAYEMKFGALIPSVLTFKKASNTEPHKQEEISETEALRFMKENCGYAAFPAGRPIANFAELNEKLEKARAEAAKALPLKEVAIMMHMNEFKSVATTMNIPIDANAITQLEQELIQKYHRLMIGNTSSF